MYNFNNLSTVKFQEKMKPSALKIYGQVFPGCHIQDLKADGNKVHVLDKEFGVDALIILPSGQWITIQEKYRKHDALKYLDFTQEFMNGANTECESPGEWFKLGAQLYFYGWANYGETNFEKWAILDVPKYKIMVERMGGLSAIGKLRQNKKHGSASFYAIPIGLLIDCFFADYRDYRFHINNDRFLNCNN